MIKNALKKWQNRQGREGIAIFIAVVSLDKAQMRIHAKKKLHQAGAGFCYAKLPTNRYVKLLR